MTLLNKPDLLILTPSMLEQYIRSGLLDCTKFNNTRFCLFTWVKRNTIENQI